MKFNDQHIPDSPFLVPVVAPMNDARRLTVTGLQVRHEETLPQPACSVLLKGSGAQLHKNLILFLILQRRFCGSESWLTGLGFICLIV